MQINELLVKSKVVSTFEQADTLCGQDCVILDSKGPLKENDSVHYGDQITIHFKTYYRKARVVKKFVLAKRSNSERKQDPHLYTSDLRRRFKLAPIEWLEVYFDSRFGCVLRGLRMESNKRPKRNRHKANTGSKLKKLKSRR